MKFHNHFFAVILAFALACTSHAISSESGKESSSNSEEQKPQTGNDQSSEAGTQWQFAAGGTFSLSSKLKFDSGTITGLPSTFSAEFQYENQFSLELDIRRMGEQSWGFMGALSYDLERKLTGGTLTYQGTNLSITSAGDPSKIQTTVLSANAVYRWERFYLPFGVNYSSVKWAPPASFVGTVSISGGLGAQLGVGYYVTDYFVLEANSRVVLVKLTSSSGSITTDYGAGFQSNIAVSAKYLF